MLLKIHDQIFFTEYRVTVKRDLLVKFLYFLEGLEVLDSLKAVNTIAGLVFYISGSKSKVKIYGKIEKQSLIL